MPKVPKNGFFYFLQDFKAQQKLKGIHYQSTADAVPDADPEWRSLTPAAKAKYEGIAKKAKEKHNMPAEKFASTGVSISEIERQEKEKSQSKEFEIQDIKNLVKTKTFSNEILDEYFYLIDVNSYCKWDNKYLIGESTILRFNLRNGIKDYYPELINPGFIPIGYASDVKEGCIDLGLDMPDPDSPSNMMDILANIIDFLRQKDVKSKALPPLFTMPEKVQPCKNFLQEMCYIANEDDMIFRVYRLDTLFYYLINSIKNHRYEGFPQESLSLAVLRKDNFRYNKGLACQHHEDKGKAVDCTDSRAFRWAYTVLDSCCPVAGIPVRPGNHVPNDLNVDKFKDDRSQRTRARIAGYEAASSSFNTTANDSMWEGNMSFTGSVVSEPSRAWAQPSGSQASSAWPPLAGTNESNDWPPLSGGGRGRPSGSQASSTSSRGRGQPPRNSPAERRPEPGRQERRRHEPMRMPQANYSQNLQRNDESMERHDPFVAPSDLGRGRGLADNLAKMNINKKK